MKAGKASVWTETASTSLIPDPAAAAVVTTLYERARMMYCAGRLLLWEIERLVD